MSRSGSCFRNWFLSFGWGRKNVVDSNAILALEVLAAKEQAKVYGPVFSRLVGISAAAFVAEKLGETAPTVNNLDQAASFITKGQSRYPKAFTALAYGVYKTVNTLEGNSGAGTRCYKSLMKKVMESMGIGKMLGHATGTLDAVKKNTKFNEEINTIEKGITVIRGDSKSAILTITGCDYIDVCRRISQEGIVRAASCGSECTYGLSDSATAEILTGAAHDYRVLKFEPPTCEYRVFLTEE
jgi:hypothetical protein